VCGAENFGRWTQCRVSIKKFKARGVRHPLSSYLLVFTPSVRHHFVLCLSIFPLTFSLSLSCTRSRRHPAACGGHVSLGGGGHDHGAGHDCRHGVSEARWRRARTGDSASEVAARASHGAAASCSYPSVLEHLPCIFTEAEDGGVCHRFMLMAVRWTGMPPRDIDEGFLPQ
jgi:hypothetical protein